MTSPTTDAGIVVGGAFCASKASSAFCDDFEQSTQLPGKWNSQQGGTKIVNRELVIEGRAGSNSTLTSKKLKPGATQRVTANVRIDDVAERFQFLALRVENASAAAGILAGEGGVQYSLSTVTSKGTKQKGGSITKVGEWQTIGIELIPASPISKARLYVDNDPYVELELDLPVRNDTLNLEAILGILESTDSASATFDNAFIDITGVWGVKN